MGSPRDSGSLMPLDVPGIISIAPSSQCLQVLLNGIGTFEAQLSSDVRTSGRVWCRRCVV